MQSFFYLFTRYLAERAQNQDLWASTLIRFHRITQTMTWTSDWDRIKSPAEDQIVPYSQLPKPKDTKNLDKLAVLKVNGGLGTSMGQWRFLEYCAQIDQGRNVACRGVRGAIGDTTIMTYINGHKTLGAFHHVILSIVH